MKQTANVRVLVYDDYEAMSRAARDVFFSHVVASINTEGQACVALSGGSTPKRMYSLLSSAGSNEPGWSHVHFFWADERCVAPDDQESNFKLAWDTFLSRFPEKERNIHRIRGEAGAVPAAREYDHDLKSFFKDAVWPVFDLIILGVGADGHTASLFPGAGALGEHAQWAVPVHVQTRKPDRVTLSLNVLKHGRHVLFLASGPEKATILHEILEDGNPRALPAGLVTPADGLVTWILDREAARLLSL